MDCDKIIFVDKPYKERRTYATLKKQWQDIDIIVTSIQMSFPLIYFTILLTYVIRNIGIFITMND